MTATTNTLSGKKAAGTPIRIVIADSDPAVRHGLRQFLQRELDFEIAGDTGDGRDLMSTLPRLDPDVLLVDLRMPNFGGLRALETLQRTNRRMKAIVLTASDHDQELALAMLCGCSGVILKHTAPSLFVKSIRKAHAGEIWLDPHIMAAAMRQSLLDTGARAGREELARVLLTSRERQIMTLVAQGYVNKEIAEEMFLSEQTIKRQLRIIFAKLGVADRLELALHAIHMGWLGKAPEALAT
jgi:DNA-binding NarL/FixJ family response regulator